MTVYIVSSDQYSDRLIRGIFSTREKAEAFAAEVRKGLYHGDEPNDIEEWRVDEEVGKVCRAVWRVMMDLASGDIHGQVEESSEIRADDDSCEIEEGATRRNQPWVIVTSPVSAEHVIKVAAEYRQGWLRRQGGGR